MAQSLSQLFVHIIFSTKMRLPFLSKDEILQETHAFLAATCVDLKCPSLAVGGVEDHVHILCSMARTMAAAGLVKELKRQSSIWLKSRDPELQGFYWQEGYGVFSVSPSHLSAVRSYIQNQKEHHKTELFQDEYRRILRKYEIEYDERYVWD
jgi:REP element-mobilizing transposase RayT